MSFSRRKTFRCRSYLPCRNFIARFVIDCAAHFYQVDVRFKLEPRSYSFCKLTRSSFCPGSRQSRMMSTDILCRQRIKRRLASCVPVASQRESSLAQNKSFTLGTMSETNSAGCTVPSLPYRVHVSLPRGRRPRSHVKMSFPRICGPCSGLLRSREFHLRLSVHSRRRSIHLGNLLILGYRGYSDTSACC